MSARRSTSDPVLAYLETGERVVWRHQPSPSTLFFNRLPNFVVVLALILFGAWILTQITALNVKPIQRGDLWLTVPFSFGALVLIGFLRFGWESIGALFDSWSTHYALTDRRFVIVSNRGIVDYSPEHFSKMESITGKDGAHVLLFDWGPAGKRFTGRFRDRIAALPDAKRLEQLIRETLKPPAW